MSVETMFLMFDFASWQHFEQQDSKYDVLLQMTGACDGGFVWSKELESLMAQSAILWWCSAVSPEKRRTGKFSLCRVKKKKQQQKTLAVSAHPAPIADIVLSRPLKLPYLI